MMDALLFAVKNAVIQNGWDYDARSCDIRVNDQPPPSIGNFFLAISPAGIASDMDNALNEYYAFDLTLSYRVTVALDRIGDQQLASQLARQPGPRGTPSLNARLENLKTFLHMNWLVMGDANNLLISMQPTVQSIYGFCEPFRFQSEDLPRLEGGAWFFAESDAEGVALVGAQHYGRCRRLQALQTFV